ncbi:MAG: hypothetical protein AB7G25_02330 [Sphingomonadaceae bacterium]
MAGGLASPASAHSFAAPYVLPIPFWIYVYGCVATLVVTFCLLSFFLGSSAAMAADWAPPVSAFRPVPRAIVAILRVTASTLFAVTILSGLIGGPDPGQNVAMTLFWVMLLLGLAYAILFAGDVFEHCNPLATLFDMIEACGVDLSRERAGSLSALGSWPALVAYFGLVWLELFAGPEPRLLAIVLIGYGLAGVLVAVMFGRQAWFAQVDPLSRMFALIGRLAPIAYRKDQSGGWAYRLRAPLSGALDELPADLATIVFILFMLSSTTFDGLHETAWWIGLFWENLLALLLPLWDGNLAVAQNRLEPWYILYQQAGLVVVPFLYLGIYALVLGWTALVTRTGQSVAPLALAFGNSLIPIALAYNFTHYATLLFAQVEGLPRLLADPFDLGWRLFETSSRPEQLNLPMALIWHLQVAVLLIGHVAGVYLAHAQAIRSFATRRQVTMSQLPLLLLMLAYTMFGLWILSLPTA